MIYNYTEKNLLEYPESYFYSKFNGVLFLESYYSKRHQKLAALGSDLIINSKFEKLKIEIISKFKILYSKNNKDNLFFYTPDFLLNILNDNNQDLNKKFNKIIQKFEITKKIYNKYEIDTFKGTGYNKNLDMYILFGICLIDFYHKTKNLVYLNSILKLSDILCSQIKTDSSLICIGTIYIIKNELYLINQLLNKNNISI